MRVRRKAKTVDTFKAQTLTEVGEPSPASTSTSVPASPATVAGGCLPLELYGHVVSLVDSPNTLRQICLVSKFLCNEGRRGLYGNVDLTMHRVSPFAWTVVNNPHIARRVHSIAITLPFHVMSMNNGRGKDIVAIVLESLPELETLEVYGQARIQLEKLLDVASPCLKRFRSSVFICQEVIDSLASRPQLRELVVPNSYPGFCPSIPESFLPGLKTLCLPLCLVHHVTNMSWGLTHLAIDLSPYRELETLTPGIVSHFGETLRNLCLTRLVPTEAHGLCPMIDLVSEFAANVRRLRFLTVSVCETLPQRYLRRIKTTDWKSFEALETLVWIAEDSVDVARHALALPMMSQDSAYVAEKFADAVYGTCPALTRFIFVNESKDPAGYRWGGDGARCELTDAADIGPYVEAKAWRTV